MDAESGDSGGGGGTYAAIDATQTGWPLQEIGNQLVLDSDVFATFTCIAFKFWP